MSGDPHERASTPLLPQGSRSDRPHGAPRRIVLVCTGNLCRSPMAAALLRSKLGDLGLENQIEVESAGVAARQGSPAAPLAEQVAAESGLDLADHRSSPVGRAVMDGAHLVIAMEGLQRQTLAQRFPERAGSIHLLAELAGQTGDVDDPYGSGSVEAYRACFRRLQLLLDAALPEILDRLGIEEP